MAVHAQKENRTRNKMVSMKNKVDNENDKRKSVKKKKKNRPIGDFRRSFDGIGYRQKRLSFAEAPLLFANLFAKG